VKGAIETCAIPCCLVPTPVAVAPFMSTRRRRPPAPAVAEAEAEASPSSWSMGRWSVGQPTVSLEAQGVSLLSPAGAGLPEGGCGAQKMNPFWLFIFALHVKIVNLFLLAFLDGFCVPPKR